MMEQYARGPNFIYSKEYVIKKYNEELWKNVIGKLSESDAAVWNGRLLPSSDYSFSTFKNFTKILTQTIGSSTQEEIAQMYEYISDRSLNTLYKIFFQFSSPSFVIKNYPKLWSRFFNVGEVIVEKAESKHAVISFKLPEIFLDWLDPACYGYSKKAVEMSGGHDLKMKKGEKKKLGNGDWLVTYELNWTE